MSIVSEPIMEYEEESMEHVGRHTLADDLPPVDDEYMDRETISAGKGGLVQKAIHRITGQTVAIKVINKTKLSEPDLRGMRFEIEALKDIDHPNICKLYQVKENMCYVVLVMEYCSGGDLHDYVAKQATRRLNEAEAYPILHQVCSAVAYLHARGYAHRDIKPENILADEQGNVKLCDFGYTVRCKDGIMENGVEYAAAGSPGYFAPEIKPKARYNLHATDVWSIGVVLYFMLSGVGTRSLDNRGMYLREYMLQAGGKYTLPKNASEDLVFLLYGLLRLRPEERITAQELVRHPVLQLYAKPLPSLSSKYDLDDNCVRKTAKYMKMPKDAARKCIEDWRYNTFTAIYMIEAEKKMRKRSRTKLSSKESESLCEAFSSVNLKTTG